MCDVQQNHGLEHEEKQENGQLALLVWRAATVPFLEAR